jgi:hypothetical protein
MEMEAAVSSETLVLHASLCHILADCKFHLRYIHRY